MDLAFWYCTRRKQLSSSHTTQVLFRVIFTKRKPSYFSLIEIVSLQPDQFLFWSLDLFPLQHTHIVNRTCSNLRLVSISVMLSQLNFSWSNSVGFHSIPHERSKKARKAVAAIRANFSFRLDPLEGLCCPWIKQELTEVVYLKRLIKHGVHLQTLRCPDIWVLILRFGRVTSDT